MTFLKKNKTFIVAEIGNNHEGNISNAFKLIDKAKASGVDAVKFQTYNTDYFVSQNYPKDSILRLKRFQLNQEQFIKIHKY